MSLAVLAALAVAEPRGAIASDASPEAPATINPKSAARIEAAKRLIAVAQLDQASHVLDGVSMTPETETDVSFLRAIIAEAKGDLTLAVALYRSILGDRPDLVRVRLELARVLFLLEEDGASRHHFERVLGADPPPVVQRNVEQFLTAIKARRRVKYRFGFSLVPDTNVNSATTSQRVNIFGLPFQLSDDARRRSGIGFLVKGGVDYYHPLGKALNVELGASGRHLGFTNDDFDDSTVYGYAGLRRYLGWSDVGLRATGGRRWFAGRGYSYYLGGRLDIGRRFSPKGSARLFLAGQKVTYDVSTILNGAIYVLQGQIVHATSIDSRAYITGGVLYEDTEDPAHSNTSPSLGVGFEKDLPWRLRVGVHPSVALRRFDELNAGFGKIRRDTFAQVRLELTYREDLFFGFAPVLTYTYTNNNSNITLFDYDRHRMELGLTAEF